MKVVDDEMVARERVHAGELRHIKRLALAFIVGMAIVALLMGWEMGRQSDEIETRKHLNDALLQMLNTCRDTGE